MVRWHGRILSLGPCILYSKARRHSYCPEPICTRHVIRCHGTPTTAMPMGFRVLTSQLCKARTSRGKTHITLLTIPSTLPCAGLQVKKKKKKETMAPLPWWRSRKRKRERSVWTLNAIAYRAAWVVGSGLLRGQKKRPSRRGHVKVERIRRVLQRRPENEWMRGAGPLTLVKMKQAWGTASELAPWARESHNSSGWLEVPSTP